MATNNKINSESDKIKLFGIITLIDEQICYEILRTIYYSQYNIYKENSYAHIFNKYAIPVKNLKHI